MPRAIDSFDQRLMEKTDNYSGLTSAQFAPDLALNNFIASGKVSSTQPSDIVSNGLVLYLDAAIGNSYPEAGTTWIDLSGRGNTGTLINGPTYSSANGRSIVFDGVNDYVSGSIPTIDTWTMSIWYLSTDITSQVVFYPFSCTTSATGLGFGGTADVTTNNRWWFFDGDNVLSNSNIHNIPTISF